MDDRTTLVFPHTGATTLPLDTALGVPRCLAAGPGGHPLHVLIDTGTDPSAIDLRLARRLAIQIGGSGLGQGAASDAVAFSEAELPWLRLGDLTIRHLFAPAIDLSPLPFQVDVVLGYNVLRQLVMRFDFQNQALRLSHPDIGLPPVSAQGAVLPLAFFEHFPALCDLTLGDERIPLATIDTGSNAALSVGPALASRLGLRMGAAHVTAGRGTGFGGQVDVLRQRGGALQIGPFALQGIELDAQLGGAGDLGRSERANIGTRLLARFAAVTLDYGRGVIVLDP